MKKLFLIMILFLSIVASVVSGTVATYTKTTDPIEGSATAKKFIIDTTTQNKNPMVSIVPGEYGTWNFSIVNYTANTVNEVNMDMTIRIDLNAADGFQPIDGLKVGLMDDNGLIGEYIVKRGYIVVGFEKAFIANIQHQYNFKVYYLWENGLAGNSVDNQNLANGNTSRISVSVTGTQCLNNESTYRVSIIDYYSEGVQKVDDPIKVTGITLRAEGGATTLRHSNNTLQIYATVTPTNATDNGIFWSVDNTVKATIDPNTGRLKSNGEIGTVTVIATAKDGSGVLGTLVINIVK